jgi:DNA-binding transcriptional MocR family regulator
MDRLIHARIGLDLGAPVLEQLVLADLLDRAEEVLPAHRERLVAGRDALVAAVREHLPAWRFRVPDGGLALWCELPEPLGTATTAEAERRGVVVAPGPVFAVEGGLDRYVRIPWTASPEALTEAVRRLAAAWEHVSDSARPTPGRSGSRGGAGRVMVA